MALAASTLALFTTRAQAEEGEDKRRRVLLLTDKANDAFMGRIKAELTSLGLAVIAHSQVASLEVEARTAHAVAAIRMLPSRKGIEVWMADETSGRSLLRQVIVDETPGGPDQNLIALQTAELLRTSFLPKAGKPPVTTTVPAAAAPTVVPAPSPAAVATGESGAQAGLGFLYTGGGAGVALQAWISLQHAWSSGLGLALDFSLPVRRGVLSGPEGSAEIGAFMAGGELFARARPSPHSFLRAGAGAAFVLVAIRGQSSSMQNQNLVSTSLSVSTGFGYVRAEAGFSPVSWLRLGVTVLGGLTFNRVNVRFTDNDAGSWGGLAVGSFFFGEADWI